MLCSQITRLFFIPALLALISLESPLSAQEEPSQPVQRDLEKFRQLPVRFNGRVTTYEVVAKNYLRRFGGRDVCFDADDQEQPAVRWLLDVMANHPDRDRWRVVRIDNPRVLKKLELAPHRNAKFSKHHFAFETLQAKETLLSEWQREVNDKPISKRKETDQDLIELYQYLLDYHHLDSSFRPPRTIDRGNAQQVLATLRRLENTPLPRFVPNTMGKPWTVYYAASVANQLVKMSEQNPLLLQLNDVFKAHRAGEPKAFNVAVKAYFQSVAKNETLKGPFQMSPSPAWVENGVNPSANCLFYFDANAHGRRIVDLSMSGADAPFLINHFQNQDIFKTDLINSWRISLGLVPLPEADLKKTWTPAKVSGCDAISIDIQTPDNVELPSRRRYITTVLQEEGQTFVMSWYGQPEVLERHREVHRQLMQSMQLGSMKELANWFPAKRNSPNWPTRRLLAAVVPDGKQIWVFVISGFDRDLKEQKDRFYAFAESLEIRKTADGITQWDWQLPEEWSKVGEFGEATLVLERRDDPLQMTITPLGEVREDTVETLIAHWARRIKATPLSKKDRDDGIKEIQVSGHKAYLIDLQGKETEPEPSKAAEELLHKAPDNWKLQQPGALIQTSYEISEGTDKAKVTIVALPARDNLALNINRWRQQLELPAKEKKDGIADTESITIDQQKGSFVDLHNPETNQRILAAVVKHGEKDWYFKMMGEAALVEKERKNFRAFLKSVKFPEKAASREN